MRVAPGADEGAKDGRHAVDRRQTSTSRALNSATTPGIAATRTAARIHAPDSSIARGRDRGHNSRQSTAPVASNTGTNGSPIEQHDRRAGACPPRTTPAQPATRGKLEHREHLSPGAAAHATARDPPPDERARRRAPAPDHPAAHALAVRSKPSPPRAASAGWRATRGSSSRPGCRCARRRSRTSGPVGHHGRLESEEAAQLGAQPQEVLAARGRSRTAVRRGRRSCRRAGSARSSTSRASAVS